MTRTSWKPVIIDHANTRIDAAAKKRQISRTDVAHLQAAVKRMTERQIYALEVFLNSSDSDEA